jgi:hypothetical protein
VGELTTTRSATMEKTGDVLDDVATRVGDGPVWPSVVQMSNPGADDQSGCLSNLNR